MNSTLDSMTHGSTRELKIDQFVDVQVNGYGGVDFNSDELTAEQFEAACNRLFLDGNRAILATIITDSIDKMCGRLSRLAELRSQSELAKKLIAGIHIEGPFISDQVGYAGVHPVEHTCDASISASERLLDAASGLVRILTLDPDRDPMARVTEYLSRKGIVVSAGHGNPSYETLARFIDAGLLMFTHLGNGCPAELPRHENIIQRVLSLADRLWISFIADGSHIPLPVLANYLTIAGTRGLAITDAMSAAGRGPGTYAVGGQEVTVDSKGLTRLAATPDSPYLAGSAATMPLIVKNLAEIGLTDERIRQLVCHTPGRIIGIAQA